MTRKSTERRQDTLQLAGTFEIPNVSAPTNELWPARMLGTPVNRMLLRLPTNGQVMPFFAR